MIDKVEVRVPASTAFTADFGRVYRDLAGDSKIFRPSPYYVRVGDLRRIGHHSLLHMYCQMDKHGNHKLELIDVGTLSFQAIQKEIHRVFDIEAGRLDIMRLDLAADVAGVSVLWFSRNARAKWKQWVADIGKIEYAQMGRRRVETVYFGKRPNCYRIYDKIAELKHQYDRMARNNSGQADLPTFEELYGYPTNGLVLTRVERQIAGGRVPRRISTIGSLRQLPDFNPFDRLELLAAGGSEPDISELGMKYYTVRGLRAEADEIGVHRLRSQLNKVSPGNASRVFREYGPFLVGDAGIDEVALYQKYQESVIRQLAA